ncbi:hypothetical protein ACTM6I_03660 [Citrobacter freundii]
MTALNKQARQVRRYTNYGVDMMEWDDGKYVKYSDYLALLAELEASQKSNEFLKEQLAQLANFNPDWDKLEAATDSLREHMAKLSAAEKRIAELKVKLEIADKLQDSAFRHGLQHGFSYGQTNDQAGYEQCLKSYSAGGKNNG